MLLKLGVIAMMGSVVFCASDKQSYDPVITQYPYHSTQERPEGTSEAEKGCYISTLNKVIPFDTIMSKYYPEDGACEYYTCEDETWNAYNFSCRSVKEKKGCKIVKGDSSQKFPGCCDQQVCDE